MRSFSSLQLPLNWKEREGQVSIMGSLLWLNNDQHGLTKSSTLIINNNNDWFGVKQKNININNRFYTEFRKKEELDDL